MAVSGGPVSDQTFEAGGDLSTKRYLIMQQEADGDVAVATAATQDLVGVLLNKPAAENRAAVVRMFGPVKCIASAAIDEGDAITATTGGKAVATTTDTNVVIGYALTAATADGEYFKLMLTGRHSLAG
jgi:hypothetical protein